MVARATLVDVERDPEMSLRGLPRRLRAGSEEHHRRSLERGRIDAPQEAWS